jgi:hypothetical protein
MEEMRVCTHTKNIEDTDSSAGTLWPSPIV